MKKFCLKSLLRRIKSILKIRCGIVKELINHRAINKSLFNSSKQRIAERSRHYIHHDELEIVIDEIMILLNQHG